MIRESGATSEINMTTSIYPRASRKATTGAVACILLTCVVAPPIVRGAPDSESSSHIARDNGGCNGGRAVPLTYEGSTGSTTMDINFCGDGFIGGVEDCDGVELGGKSCVDLGLVGGPLGCDSMCVFDERMCVGCGNGTLDVGEVCDGPNQLNGQSCIGLGYNGGILGCDPKCQLLDESGCFKCGDGNPDMGEACDCGAGGAACTSAQLGSQDCTSLAAPMNGNYHGGTLGCKSPTDCNSFDTAQCEYCGDNVINGPGLEACDDKALGGATCVAQGYQNGTPTCAPDCGSIDYTPCMNPICGDSLIVGAEACDDGNTADGDGCAGDCMHEERWVFVSSEGYQGDLGQGVNPVGNLKGLLLADARCQGLAEAVMLPGTYKAWLSDGTGSPSTRFDKRFTGYYRLALDPYLVVATGWAGLTGMLENAIDIDEKGGMVDSLVWTNTTVAGEKASDLHCMGWTSKAAGMGNTTTAGTSSQLDDRWTVVVSGQSCNGTNRLYCFQGSR